MAISLRDIQSKGFGATARRDVWWLAPLLVVIGLGAFGVYSTWAAYVNAHYEWGPYLSPFYSPLFKPAWLPTWISPAFLILGAPLGFRGTCYYYRKAYYRAFFLDPVACGVGEPRQWYNGERKLFIIQNAHRFFMYLAVIFIFILGYDAIVSFIWPVAGVARDGSMPTGPREFGMGVGSVVMTLNVILLAAFTFGCHALRHAVGGKVDCFSCAAMGKPRYKLWRGVTFLNRNHQFWAWVSLVWVGLTDVYIRLVSMGVITDVRLF